MYARISKKSQVQNDTRAMKCMESVKTKRECVTLALVYFSLRGTTSDSQEGGNRKVPRVFTARIVNVRQEGYKRDKGSAGQKHVFSTFALL